MDRKQENSFGAGYPLALPEQDRIFCGIYHGAYLTASGMLYSFRKDDSEGIQGKKDGMPLIATNVVSAAAGIGSIAYVTRDGHLHVHGGPLESVFAEGPAFTGAKSVFSFHINTFLAIGLDGKKYVFGENHDNMFNLQGEYRFQMNVRAADEPEILKVMRERKDDFGKIENPKIFPPDSPYWAWEKEVAHSPEAMRLHQIYQGRQRILPTVKYHQEDGSPEGMYAFAAVPNSYVIRPDSDFLDGTVLSPENVLCVSHPFFSEEEVWQKIDPKAHKKAIYLEDEGRWLFLDGTELYRVDLDKKTVIANDVADVDLCGLRALILTTSGQLFQSTWRNVNGTMLEGMNFGSFEYPFSSLPAFRGRQAIGFLGKAFNSLLSSDWEEIHWRP